MVYCNLVEKTDHTVTYDFGGMVNDITGRFVFDFKNKHLEIVREPILEMAPIRHIHSLLRIHQKQFLSGLFKERISYES